MNSRPTEQEVAEAAKRLLEADEQCQGTNCRNYCCSYPGKQKEDADIVARYAKPQVFSPLEQAIMRLTKLKTARGTSAVAKIFNVDIEDDDNFNLTINERIASDRQLVFEAYMQHIVETSQAKEMIAEEIYKIQDSWPQSFEHESIRIRERYLDIAERILLKMQKLTMV